MSRTGNRGVQEEDTPFLTDGDSHLQRVKRHRDRKICLVVLIVLAVVIVFISAALIIPCVYVLVLSPEQQTNSSSPVDNCSTHCKLSIVESIPENLTYNINISHISTYTAWMQLLQAAHTNVTISSYYWTLRGTRDISDITDKQGLDIFNELKKTAARGISIRVVQGPPSSTYPNNDTRDLANMKAISLRSLNMSQLLGAGIIHTKMWIVDNEHFYIGSANMDWRSLTQVKELGLLGMNCSCLGNDAQKIFEVYWAMADSKTVPSEWPDDLQASFNISNPAQLKVNGTSTKVFLGSSPPQLSTKYRTDDLTGLLKVINSAKKFVYIAVMDYIPAMIYMKAHTYWPIIDDALKTAAYERGIQVRVLGSYWNHTSSDMVYFMTSLGALNHNIGQHKGTIETKLFIVPSLNNKTIPFTRVNHNKYMVTDNAAYIGTSNWSEDYFVNTGGVSCVVNQTSNNTISTIQGQLKNIFDRDWYSQYSKNMTDVL